MRGIYSSVTDIRRKIFTEIARMAYDGDYSVIEELPFKIIPGEVATYRESIFLERAIVGERLRLAMGLPLRKIDQHTLLSNGISESAIAEKYYEPPLINIIKFACHACPDNIVKVTDACQGCLAHPCREVCPKGAIEIVNGRSVIDQEKCIKCGLCIKSCPYNAIMKLERPCAKACGMDAIRTDENGHADIDYDKCVSCGMCLVNCPFGAISDKGQIFQLITAMKRGYKVYAAVAPAFVGQLGPKVTPEKLKGAMKALGFEDTIEVAVGADLCTIEEAEDFLDKVPEKQPFMGTSCCPAWSVMAKKLFPEFKPYISMALTPMVLTARMIKKEHPDCKVVFVGPCAAKKLEASRKSVRSDVDFVLTFEEIMGMFEAKDIHFEDLTEIDELSEATADGRGFAVSGGVAQAVVNCIHEKYPDKEVKVHAEESLRNCRKMLQDAKKGVYDGYLLEGMACPGGCIAGAGTLQSIVKAKNAVNRFKNSSQKKVSSESQYAHKLDDLVED
ncbi:MAG: 4Fe-4S dicluster domain-containing protein [Longibaculum muris]|uniref:[FeFe] hydrogenase (Group B1/B3) n=1 Tax=Longibaculum muris TaxID=1796628 RepID=A0A4R3Z7B0_9FIRM|nr:4Fe-4S dicluster domain-containing protein [Longibaculum muris]MBS5369580.1 4Fe-4S dicluster domain-containing protein [Coprobacillus cateniformis]MCR1886688.1 4Fe-4S dicluster domain-containing protein [Longibaculum muris]MED9813163.1 4Fe-4S dicluster domain-containing protein [Longibaculum muris]TCW01743.1 [FeFe] hydrogenase (group B1/B3) [Longibaculum muris]